MKADVRQVLVFLSYEVSQIRPAEAPGARTRPALVPRTQHHPLAEVLAGAREEAKERAQAQGVRSRVLLGAVGGRHVVPNLQPETRYDDDV